MENEKRFFVECEFKWISVKVSWLDFCAAFLTFFYIFCQWWELNKTKLKILFLKNIQICVKIVFCHYRAYFCLRKFNEIHIKREKENEWRCEEKKFWIFLWRNFDDWNESTCQMKIQLREVKAQREKNLLLLSELFDYNTEDFFFKTHFVHFVFYLQAINKEKSNQNNDIFKKTNFFS